MTKSLTKRVEQYARQRGRPLKDAVGMYITANRNQIEAAVREGYSIKIIWETIAAEGRLKCTYQAFQQKMKKEFGSNNSAPPPKPAQEILAAKISKDSFVFNSKPSVEELY